MVKTETVSASRRHVCFISNGHGEDHIGATILRHWDSERPDFTALPIVGAGGPYRAQGIPLVGPCEAMPSGGFILRDPGALLRDLKTGLVGLTLRQIRALRGLRAQLDLVVAVGDIVPLAFAWLTGVPYVFVGCAKSSLYGHGSISRYNALERFFIRHERCLAVYPRDTATTRTLLAKGVRAYDFGNPMMDEVSVGVERAPEAGRRVVGLLPGSRNEAYDNLPHLLRCCEALVAAAPTGMSVEFSAAVAPGLEHARLIEAAKTVDWSPDRTGERLMGPDGTSVRLFRDRFSDWIQQMDGVIGLAGTANEQCVGAGLPVVTFPGTGPQFTPAFAAAQARLLGESITLVERYPARVARSLWDILLDPQRLASIRTNGRDRMGPSGAGSRIARHIASLLDASKPDCTSNRATVR